MTLTQEQKADYLNSRGARCPYCKSEAIQGREPQADGDVVTIVINCDTCEQKWADCYRLMDVFEESWFST